MNPQLIFVARLRRERQRNGITLEQIAADSRIKPELLEAFENNDLTDWPRGLYARAWIRAYAVAVGLDPVDTVDEFCRLYLHGDRRARSTMRELATIAEESPGYIDSSPQEERRKGERIVAELTAPSWQRSLRRGWAVVRATVVALWQALFGKPRRAYQDRRSSPTTF